MGVIFITLLLHQQKYVSLSLLYNLKCIVYNSQQQTMEVFAWQRHGKYIMQIIADANLVNYFHGGPSGPKKLFTGKNLYLFMQFKKYDYEGSRT